MISPIGVHLFISMYTMDLASENVVVKVIRKFYYSSFRCPVVGLGTLGYLIPVIRGNNMSIYGFEYAYTVIV